MNESLFIRVDLGKEWVRSRLVDRFRESLCEHGLVRDDYLYHAFDGAKSLDCVMTRGCDVEKPSIYSCGTALGIVSLYPNLYNPLESGVLLEKPGILVYKRQSFECINARKGLYHFRDQDYALGLIAILLAKRPNGRSRTLSL